MPLCFVVGMWHVACGMSVPSFIIILFVTCNLLHRRVLTTLRLLLQELFISKIGQSHEGMSPFAGRSTTSPSRLEERRWEVADGTNKSVSGRLSWPGEALTPKPQRFHFQRFVQKEWSSVMFWVLVSVGLAVAVETMVECGNMREQWSQENDMRLGLAILSDWTLTMLPSPVKAHLAPGFLISNGIILLAIQCLSGSCPNFICRICEFQMGRVHKRGILSAVTVHSIGSAALVILLKRGLSEATVVRMLALQDSRPPAFCSCLGDFVKETIMSTVFPVVYFTAPTLLRLNGIPFWVFLFLLYPIYSKAVDGDGRASLLSPTVTLITCFVVGRGWWRILAQCLGGFMGGRIMCRYFPDDPKA